MTLVLILLLCLLLRLGMSVRESKKPLTGDALTYTKIALHIARGDGFRTGPIEHPDEHRITAFGNPIYPVFLAGIYRAFGLNVLAVLVIQSLLDTLTCLIVFWLTLKVARSRSAATVAALLYTIYPPFIYWAAWPYTETLTALLLAPAAYLYWISLTGRARLAAGAGALMGIIMLLRPAMLFFAPFVFGVLA
jgi:4-amino-4-deoxy-L-arabinose transferase-like glycosyltransferase